MKDRHLKRLPSPAEIAKRAAEIRARWTEKEWRKRSWSHAKPWHVPAFCECATTRSSDGLEPLEPID